MTLSPLHVVADFGRDFLMRGDVTWYYVSGSAGGDFEVNIYIRVTTVADGKPLTGGEECWQYDLRALIGAKAKPRPKFIGASDVTTARIRRTHSPEFKEYLSRVAAVAWSSRAEHGSWRVGDPLPRQFEAAKLVREAGGPGSRTPPKPPRPPSAQQTAGRGRTQGVQDAADAWAKVSGSCHSGAEGFFWMPVGDFRPFTRTGARTEGAAPPPRQPPPPPPPRPPSAVPSHLREHLRALNLLEDRLPDAAALKAAWTRAALATHPDTSGRNSSAEFQRVKEAHTRLREALGIS